MASLFQGRGKNFELFLDFFKQSNQLYLFIKCHSDMFIYIRDTTEGTCILYVLCAIPFWTAHRSQNDDVINL